MFNYNKENLLLENRQILFTISKNRSFGIYNNVHLPKRTKNEVINLSYIHIKHNRINAYPVGECLLQITTKAPDIYLLILKSFVERPLNLKEERYFQI